LMKANLARCYALAGKRAEARQLLKELTNHGPGDSVSGYRIATVWLALGDAGAAFECLQRACRERDHWMAFLKVDPMLQAIPRDRRFARLLQQVGLPRSERPPPRPPA